MSPQGWRQGQQYRVSNRGNFWQIFCRTHIGYIIEQSDLTAMPRWNILRAAAHLLSNYSSSASEVAYLLVEAHRACSASWDGWHWGRGEARKVRINADAPSGDMEGTEKFINRCCQSCFCQSLSQSYQLSPLQSLLTGILNKSLSHRQPKNSWWGWKFTNDGKCNEM